MVKTGGTERKIEDPAFARRLSQACDTHPQIPALNYGRLTWVRTNLENRFGEKVSIETVRKWFAGETRPRHAKMKLLAQLIEADEAWLSLGAAVDMAPRERKARNVAVGAAVNLLAGFIGLVGGRPAFPEENDPRSDTVDLYAVIRGAQYAFKVLLAQPAPNGALKMSAPAGLEDSFVVGVIPGEGFSAQFVELDQKSIERVGVRKGGFHEIAIMRTADGFETDGIQWRVIDSFASRL